MIVYCPVPRQQKVCVDQEKKDITRVSLELTAVVVEAQEK